jgi:hypothetical protein
VALVDANADANALQTQQRTEPLSCRSVHGATATAGGSVTYSVYRDNTCATLYAGHHPSDNPVTVTNGVVPNSGSLTFDYGRREQQRCNGRLHGRDHRGR